MRFAVKAAMVTAALARAKWQVSLPRRPLPPQGGAAFTAAW
jgi:hypothetical protein